MKILCTNNLDPSLILACNFLCFSSTITDPITGLTQSVFTCAIAKRLITKYSLVAYQSFQSAGRKKKPSYNPELIPQVSKT